MGHSNCGAVTATIDHLSDTGGEPAEVVSLLYRIEPAIIGLSKELPREERISLAVRRNMELAIRRLSRVPALHRSTSTGRVKIVGAIYDMHTGKVGIVEDPVIKLE
jgi:carbonic anhydrase